MLYRPWRMFALVAILCCAILQLFRIMGLGEAMNLLVICCAAMLVLGGGALYVLRGLNSLGMGRPTHPGLEKAALVMAVALAVGSGLSVAITFVTS